MSVNRLSFCSILMASVVFAGLHTSTIDAQIDHTMCTEVNQPVESKPDYDVSISDAFGTQEEREEIRGKIKKAISAGKPVFSIYPSTCFALSKGAAVSGYGGAMAKTILGNVVGETDAIWETELLSAQMHGDSKITITVMPEECEVTFIAASMIFSNSEACTDDVIGDKDKLIGSIKEMAQVGKGLAKEIPFLDILVEKLEEMVNCPVFVDVQSRTIQTHRINDVSEGKLENRNFAQIVRFNDKTLRSDNEKKCAMIDTRSAIVKRHTLTFSYSGNIQVEAQATGNSSGKVQVESGWVAVWIWLCKCPDEGCVESYAGCQVGYAGKNFESFTKESAKNLQEAVQQILKTAGGETSLSNEDIRQNLEKALKDWLRKTHPEGGVIWSPLVDNVESYNNFLPTDPNSNRICKTWESGGTCNIPPYYYLGNGTGSMVDINSVFVREGGQSMKFSYDNTGTHRPFPLAPPLACYSETTASTDYLEIGGDWTVNNVKALSLWFYGAPANAAEQLYVGLEDNAGHIKVVNHPDPEAVQIGTWQEWNIELTQFSGAGVNLAAVKKMYIGVGDRDNPQPGGTGTLYFDDIRLYPPRCVPSLLKPAADFTGDCVVNYSDLVLMADEWLIKGGELLVPQTDVYKDGKVDFKDFAILSDMWLEEQFWP